jgi:hypothetical protein
MCGPCSYANFTIKLFISTNSHGINIGTVFEVGILKAWGLREDQTSYELHGNWGFLSNIQEHTHRDSMHSFKDKENMKETSVTTGLKKVEISPQKESL